MRDAQEYFGFRMQLDTEGKIGKNWCDCHWWKEWIILIKEQIKCPKCGKVLLRGYSMAILEITCKCGHTINLKKNHRKVGATDGTR